MQNLAIHRSVQCNTCIPAQPMQALNQRLYTPVLKLGLLTNAWRGRSDTNLRRTVVTMAASSYKYVVLGGGNSAGYAAREFVERGVAEGELAVVSSEPYVAYERPALSKAYLFPESPARLPGFHTCVGGGGERQDPEWYKKHGVDFKLNTTVTGADVKAKTLTTASGDTITYEKLVIATGSGVIDLARDFKVPGADQKGFFYLRDIVDGDAMVAAIADLKAKDGKVVVVGGGYIGMEIAASLAKNGLKPTVIFPEPYLLSRMFTPELASFYESYFESKGVSFIKNTSATSFEGKDGQVTTTVLKNGDRIQSDMVVVGVGAKPTGEMFKGQIDFLEERPGGIKTNGHLQTSDDSIYAIGDIAAFPMPRYGGKVTRQEHVQNARESAKHAVTAIMAPSEASEYNYLPFYGDTVGEVVMFGDMSTGKFGAYWVKGGKVVGGFLESGSPDENASLKKLALETPTAPASADLAKQGLEFAAKL